MTIPSTPDLNDSRLAHEQALRYGKDLAQVYQAEKSRRQELEVAYQALSAVLQNTPDGLVVLDYKECIQQTNRAFSSLVEQSVDELIGEPLTAMPAFITLHPVLDALTADAHAPGQIELEMSQPTRRSLVVNIAPLRTSTMHGWILVFHDQTRLKRLEFQKGEFINIAAHELRTPLTAILGYGQLLAETWAERDVDFASDERDYLDAVLRGSARLKGIINELVEFATLNGGEVQPTGILRFQIADLLQNTLNELQMQAAARQVTLQFTLSDPDLSLTANAALLQIALRQLLLNAINFNKPGGAVRLEAEQGVDTLQLRVRDTGIGIPQTDLDSIFAPFFQVEGHDQRQTGGLGLGLPIVKRATQLLGATLAVTSKLNTGTIVTLTLPLAQPAGEFNEAQNQIETSRKQSLIYARDLKKLYRELQQTNRQLEGLTVQLDEANKLKSNFLAAISHELRSPFVPIDLALQSLTRGGLDNLTDWQRELFGELKTSSASARKMIDNLVAYAGLLSKQGRLTLEAVSLSELLTESAAIIAPMVRSRKLTLTTTVPPELILPAADRQRLAEAIWHLLHNAVKFTAPGGRIELQAHIENNRVAILVEDTGVGIPLAQQAALWEAFGQLSDALKRGVEGLGLGLALVRYVAMAHGGQVILDSSPGTGSLIGFWLPLTATADDKQVTTS